MPKKVEPKEIIGIWWYTPKVSKRIACWTVEPAHSTFSEAPFDEKCIPQSTAHKTPIHTGGSKENTSNYKSIHINSAVGKSQCYFKSQLDWVKGKLGRQNLKSWEMLEVERWGWNLVGKISTSPRYRIDITGTDLLSLGELGGMVISKN